MQKKDWLRLVAAHSDAWLYSVAFYYGAKLKQHERWVLGWWPIDQQMQPWVVVVS